jgi:hypothetical protein
MKIGRRFRKPLPFAFGLCAFLALVGGLLYAPTTYDALSYRLPRLFHWLADKKWHWISTNNERMNLSGTGFEWLMAPLLAIARSDRPLFLINFVAFLLLPGMLFGTLRRLGVSPRVAWFWMWPLPCGLCFVLQAGGLGNDLICATYFLAALYFTLKARDSRRPSDLFIGAISAALMTGAKASNLPLLLPWVLAALPSLRLIRWRSVAPYATATLCLGVSFLPMAALNLHFTGDWSGDPNNRTKVKLDSPLYGVIGNGLELVSGNLAPPVAPFAPQWNAANQRLLGSPAFQPLVTHYPRFTLAWYELPGEEGAGVGLGLTILLFLTALAASRFRNHATNRGASRETKKWGWRICAGGFVALIAYMAKTGSEAAPRLVTPYYPLLFASVLLLPGNALLVRRNWWQAVALLPAVCALPVLVLTPSRPLWPALSALHLLQDRFPRSSTIHRAATVYSVYSSRSDGLAPLRKFIPPGALRVGFIGDDDPETSLWKPFGSRRVVDVTAANQRELIESHIPAIILSPQSLRDCMGSSLDAWLAENRLKVLGREVLATKASREGQEWYVVGPEVGGP